MKSFKEFLLEQAAYSKLQRFVIQQWGKVLYLDYLSLPMGVDETVRSTAELLNIVNDYESADGEDERLEIEEWVAEGAPLKNGRYLLSRKTVDAILSSAQHPAGTAMTLYRFDVSPNPLKPNSWISLTRKTSGYSGTATEYQIAPTDLIIDAHGLADDGEVIVNTNLLLAK